jgi:hypothetical protein
MRKLLYFLEERVFEDINAESLNLHKFLEQSKTFEKYAKHVNATAQSHINSLSEGVSHPQLSQLVQNI